MASYVNTKKNCCELFELGAPLVHLILANNLLFFPRITSQFISSTISEETLSIKDTLTENISVSFTTTPYSLI